jgi:AcrR family transcriptional regulator
MMVCFHVTAKGSHMAKKTRKSSRASKSKADPRDRVIDAALKLAAERGWRRLAMSEIADAAGMSLAEVCSQFSSKSAILNGFHKRIDERVLASGPADGSSARDRLFDVLMRRLDNLQPYRDAIRLIARDIACDPLAALCQGPQLMCSMARMLKAGGLKAGGINGAIRTKGLALIYVRTLCVWLGDDSKDLSKTMAVLDRGLARAERLVGILCPAGTRTGAPETKPA